MSNLNVNLGVPQVNANNKMTKDQFYKFVHSEVVNFLASNGLDKIQVDDGCGNKASIRIDKNGEYKVQITSAETV